MTFYVQNYIFIVYYIFVVCCLVIKSLYLKYIELAGILGLKPTAISNYESNRNEPSFEKLIALSKEFDVTCDYLLGVSDSALPIGGEILDNEIVDFFLVYQQLMPESAASIRDYAEYLLDRQENKRNRKQS